MRSSTWQGLISVATGLSLVYGGLCLLVISAFVPFVGQLLVQQMGLGGDKMFFVIFLAQALIALAIGLDVAGRLFCLRVPAEESQARPIIFVSVFFSIAGLVFTPLLLIPAIREQLPQYVVQLQLGLTVIGSVLFILFLRLLAQRVRRKDLVRKATAVLTLGSILVLGILGFVAWVMFDRLFFPQGIQGIQNNPLGIFIPLGLIVLAIVTLVTYGNLLTYLRQAIASITATDLASGSDDEVDDGDQRWVLEE